MKKTKSRAAWERQLGFFTTLEKERVRDEKTVN